MNRSIDQLNDRSIDQLINYQSIKWSLARSINQSIDRSIERSLDRSINQSINRSITQSMNEWINQFQAFPTPESQLWQPEGDVTRQEWMACNGMPCDQFHRTQEKMRQILQLHYRLTHDLDEDEVASAAVRQDQVTTWKRSPYYCPFVGESTATSGFPSQRPSKVEFIFSLTERTNNRSPRGFRTIDAHVTERGTNLVCADCFEETKFVFHIYFRCWDGTGNRNSKWNIRIYIFV